MSKNKGNICAILSAVFFGLAPLCAKLAYHYGCTPLMASFGRFLAGSAMLFIIAAAQDRENIIPPPDKLKKIIFASIFYALMIVLLYSSYEYIDSGIATTLHFSYPVFVIVTGFIFFHKRIAKKQLFCTLLAVLGVVLLNGGRISGSSTGIAIAVLSGLSYAVYIVLTEGFGLTGMNTFVLTAWVSGLASAEVGAGLLLTGNFTLSFGIKGTAAIILLAVVTNVCASVLFQKSVSICGGAKASLLSTFEPLTSLLVGLMLFGERLSITGGAGIILVLTAAALSV